MRHSFYANVAYAVTESDILEVTDGVSTVFCSEHMLQMNGTFNAFQMTQKPEITSYRQHIRLKKSMNLPDDTLEYWGFYLLKGASVALSVCSRFQGASILVVKGERNLRTCGLLEHNRNKQVAQGIFIPNANRQVKITFESNAQVIDSQAYDYSNPTRPSSGKTQIEDSTKKTDTVAKDSDLKFTTHTLSQNDRENKSLEELFQTAERYIKKHVDDKDSTNIAGKRRIRHIKGRRHRKEKAIKKNDRRKTGEMEHPERPTSSNKFLRKRREYLVEKLKGELYSAVGTNVENEEEFKSAELIDHDRRKRSQELIKPPSLLDRGILHGGNAGRNASDSMDMSSVSSFESGLFNCYGGSILLAEEFEPSNQCVNVTYLLSGKHMETRHNVAENGYYYYIFYSDNDIVSNDIYAVFDIYKPTFQYENVTKSCINQTECTFSLSIFSDDRVIVEVPTKNGIEHEVDDTALLISICHPRMGIYMIFPIAVLFLIISCAFM